jgi:hypothetical protein
MPVVLSLFITFLLSAFFPCEYLKHGFRAFSPFYTV